jgi:hypothetical protein
VSVGGISVKVTVGGIDVNVGVITTCVGMEVNVGTLSGVGAGAQDARNNKDRKSIEDRFI